MERDELMEKISDLINKYFSNSKKSFVPGETKIPLASPSYGSEEIIEAIDSLVSTWVTMGKKVQKFENEFAKYIGVKHAIMVNSGSSANLLAFSILTNPKLSSSLKPGDEVITPDLTWPTTVYPIFNTGLTPLFVDVDIDSFNINVEKIEKAITNKTKVIFPVHLLGNPAEIEKIKEIAEKNDLLLLEDSCEAHGAEYNGRKIGSFGDMATFSFFLSHHITTIEGGILVTNNDEYYEIGKALRAFGWIRDLKNKTQISKQYQKIDPRFLFVNVGFNIRPTELQGAFGIHQIKKLENFIELRRKNVKFWNNYLSKFSNYIQTPIERPKTRHVSFGYSIFVKENAGFDSKQLSDYLESKKIEVRPIMAGNIVNQPVSKIFDYKTSGSLDNANKIMKNAIFLPNHQDIKSEEREYIANCLVEFLEEKVN